MPRLLLVGIALLATYYGVVAANRYSQRLSRKKRKRLAWFALSTVGAVILIAVFARFGLHWLGIVGAGALALLRVVGPTLLRLLPFAHRLHNERRRGAWVGSNAGSDEGSARARGTQRATMTRSEAIEVLGLEEAASKEDVLAAYRVLIRKVHPDTPGGSTYLASKVNQAKDVLLG